MNWDSLTHNPITRAFAGLLTVLLVAMAGWGWLDRTLLWDGLTKENFIGGILTALGATAQLGTNLAAIHWRKAHGTDGWFNGSILRPNWDAIGCMVAMAACGLFTHAGLENAWLLSQGRFPGLESAQIGLLVPAMLWAAPWLEPFLYWRLDKEWDKHVLETRALAREEDERRSRETRELTQLTEARMARAARDMGRELERATLDGMTQPFTDPPQIVAEASQVTRLSPAPSQAADPSRARRRPTKWPPEKKAEVVALRTQKITYREIEEKTGVPHESARRIFEEYEERKEAA